MLTNLRILDSELQMGRIFGSFGLEYDTIEDADGLYDIVFTHRELMQDNFESIQHYLKPNSKIVTDISTESGNIGVFLDSYEKITNQYSYQFFFICDATIPNKNRFGSNVKILDKYEILFHAFLNEYSDNKMSINNTLFADTHDGFISLNNSCRIHRVYLFTQLLKRNLSLEKCSFLFSTGTPTGWLYNEEVLKNTLDHLLETNIIDLELYNQTINYQLPKRLDYDNTIPTYIYNDINELYKTILNLVSENLTGMTDGDISDPYIITFTEKVVKPFLSKQIPLFFGLPGLIELLRKLEFDVYDDIINHSYDLELNPIKRLDLILDELERLTQIDLLDYKTKNANKFDENYNLLFKLSNDGYDYLKSFLYEEILK